MTARNLLRRTVAASSTGITLIATAGTQNSATGGSLTLNKPSGTLTGHIMVMLLHTSSSQNGTWTVPSGWTQVFSETGSPDLDIWYKVALAGEAASYSISFSRTNSLLAGAILTYSNAIWGGIGAVDEFNGAATNTRLAPGATAGFKNTTALAVYSIQRASETFTTPSGWSSVYLENDANIPSLAVFSTSVGNTDTSSNATTTLSASTNAASAGIQLFLARSSAAQLSSYSSTAQGATSTQVTSETITVNSGSGSITCPTGVTVSIAGGAYSSTGNFTSGQTIAFRWTTGASYNVSVTHTITVGSDTIYTWTVNTNNYAIITTSGNFIVPAGVSSISMLCLGSGAGGGDINSVPSSRGGGGGGGLSYQNSVAVTAGETLTITVGAGGGAATAGSASTIKRGATTLIQANGGSTTTTTTGGAGASTTGAVGTVKFAGGAGGAATTSSYNGGWGGGAATTAAAGPTGANGQTYTVGATVYISAGEGGRGTNFTSTGWSTVGPVADSSNNGSGGSAGNSYGGGGGGSLTGSGGNYYPGQAGAAGVVVMIWAGRTFSTATTY